MKKDINGHSYEIFKEHKEWYTKKKYSKVGHDRQSDNYARLWIEFNHKKKNSCNLRHMWMFPMPTLKKFNNTCN